MQGLGHEYFYLFTFNRDFRLIRRHLLTRGSGEHLQIYYRDILKVILNDRCTYTIIAHNHPDGSALPGRVDISNMRKLTQLLKPIGVTLRDQYIVGRDGAYSCNLERYLYKQ